MVTRSPHLKYLVAVEVSPVLVVCNIYILFVIALHNFPSVMFCEVRSPGKVASHAIESTNPDASLRMSHRCRVLCAKSLRPCRFCARPKVSKMRRISNQVEVFRAKSRIILFGNPSNTGNPGVWGVCLHIPRPFQRRLPTLLCFG